MNVSPIKACENYHFKTPNFASNTIYNERNVIEEDVISLYGTKKIFNNTLYPNSQILGIKLKRQDDKNIDIISRYGHNVGQINYNPKAKQPKINLKLGAHQPIVELVDEELGISILMTRGSLLEGKDLNINYKNLSNYISFGHKLVIATGYKSEKTQQVVEDYFKQQKYKSLLINKKLSEKLKEDYTIVGLCGGFGTRFSPISDIEDTNKPSTKYPGIDKSLLEMSVLDLAHQLKINETDYLNDARKNLSGTAGIIIKGLKDGTIPQDKPLIVLTGDTFNNIDLLKALENYEADDKSGIAMVVSKVDNAYGKSCVSFEYNHQDSTFYITDLSDLVNEQNKDEIKEKFGVYNPNAKKVEYFSSTNILIINPTILNLLKKYAISDGSADLTRFLGLMFNVMNKSNQSLSEKYPNGLHSKELTLKDLTYTNGKSKGLFGKNHQPLTLRAIIAQDTNGNSAICEDVGTIENFIQTMQTVKNKNISGINEEILSGIKNNVSDENVIFFDKNTKERLSEFKSKYGIKNLSGNVIIHTAQTQNKTATSPKSLQNSYNLINNNPISKQFIEKVCFDKKEAQIAIVSFIKENGLANFLTWYMSPNGYYGAFEEYVADLYKNATSIDELFKLMPNWAPWKLEQKAWMLKHPEHKRLSESEQETLFNNANDKQREEKYTVGTLPKVFHSELDFEKLVEELKSSSPNVDWIYNRTHKIMQVQKLKGGELNDKFVYKLKIGDKIYILKFDRTNVEDLKEVDGRKLSTYEKKILRKNKYLAPDSVYSGACISKYLELNGCENIPKLLYYNNCANAALYEYIEDINDDKFQKGILGDDCEDILRSNKTFSSLNDLGIYLNDTAYKNILTDENGVKKVIDLGHSNFMHPFKPGVKRYNITFSNSNGPDLSSIFGSILAILQV